MTFRELWPQTTARQRVRRAAWDSGHDSVSGAFHEAEDALLSGVVGLADMLADDWEIASKPMDFATAMRHLQEVKIVRRRSWENREHCLARVDLGPINGTPSGIIYATSQNVNATDWEVIE